MAERSTGEATARAVHPADSLKNDSYMLGVFVKLVLTKTATSRSHLHYVSFPLGAARFTRAARRNVYEAHESKFEWLTAAQWCIRTLKP